MLLEGSGAGWWAQVSRPDGHYALSLLLQSSGRGGWWVWWRCSGGELPTLYPVSESPVRRGRGVPTLSRLSVAGQWERLVGVVGVLLTLCPV